jgi:sugar phosphate isomerase/epimerase
MELDGLHLGYCTNIHAGETWPEVQEALRTRLLEVRNKVTSAKTKFGIGLRLSDIAARELEAPAELDKFREFLAENNLYVYTINGFPFGQFHGTRVKERVYLPDWLDDARVEYSDRLARILAAIVPDGIEGSISTVPGAFKPRAPGTEEQQRIANNLLRHAETLVRLAGETGKKISLALEPEPACLIETTAETIEFFETHLFSRSARKDRSELFLREHFGVCFDACHMSVEHEPPEEAVANLQKAGIRIVKAQISAGLKVELTEENLDTQLSALEPFAEETYLHQVVEKRGTALHRFVDLPEAIAAARRQRQPGEWRIHFHVPIFLAKLGAFASTQDELARLLHLIRRTGCTQHLEVETYCWDVLPAEHRKDDMAEAIARELLWTKDQVTR